MGIHVEFNPHLCLRKFEEGRSAGGERITSECLPRNLERGRIYDFLKKGQRNYYLMGEVSLRITEGNGKLSRPVASVQIVEATHYLLGGEIWTRGKYEVVELYEANDKKIHFDGLEKISEANSQNGN